jgi:hypothetical protein
MTLDTVPFLGPKLKVQRAVHHIEELHAVLRAYVARDPHRLVGEVNTKVQLRRIVFRIRESLPPVIPLIAGDAVHNLRSALDIMVCDMAAIAGDNTRKARFPFWRDISGEKEAWKKITTLSNADKKIIYAIKNNKEIDDYLRVLHDLDIIDKHRGILAGIEMVAITRYRRGEQITLDIQRRRVRDGDVVEVLPIGEEPDIDNEPRGTFDVTFADGQPLAGESIGQSLTNLADAVRQIINLCEHGLPPNSGG